MTDNFASDVSDGNIQISPRRRSPLPIHRLISLSSNLPQNPSRPHHRRRPIKEPTIAGSLTPPRRRRPLRTAWRVHVLLVEEEREEAAPPCLAAAAPCRRRCSTSSQTTVVHRWSCHSSR
ncbi:hypothetical protein PIB30_040432 [Stylosanthes scabra]|uniref:Uncharacterized protein n=1 Tax=Stylosanthes scabra TaxID=79078 RepID=A0ABU6TGN2_9FABA|nr:hypothetical protein [Stylosanthes scabra]